MNTLDCVYVNEYDEDIPVKAVYDPERQQVTVFDANNQVLMLPDEVFDNESEPAIFDNISEENWKELVEEAKRLNNDISMFLFG